MHSNRSALFLCRAPLLGNQYIGVTSAGTNYCTLTYNGVVYSPTRYSIPNQIEFGHYMWTSEKQKAIKVGQDVKGQPLYLCQSNINGHPLPGVTWPGYNYCNIAYQGKEVIMPITNVLSNM